MRAVLTIAGSDCSGGAGIQADIKTIAVHGLYAMSAVTALTAQNTTGVYGIWDVSPEFLEKQLDCIFQDIHPDAVKVGMVSSTELIEVITRKLKEYRASHVVVDPVMVSTSASRLLRKEAERALTEMLLPLAEIVTPNIPEAETLADMQIESAADMEAAAACIGELTGGAVLVKGGHRINDANDFLWNGEKGIWILGDRVDNENTHGTGCTLSSAIASNLAMGYSVEQSVRNAKEYLTGALKDGMNLGAGNGPLNHIYCVNSSNCQKPV